MERHQITNPEDIGRFIFGGHAIFTIVSSRTGVRFTYQVNRGEERNGMTPPWFVRLLSGPDNTSHFTYLGTIFPGHQDTLTLTQKSRAGADAPSVLAFRWLLRCITAKKCTSIEFWHEGRCGRCGRRLTVPTSIETGLGPVCSGLIAA
jgi:hypothetical protein